MVFRALFAAALLACTSAASFAQSDPASVIIGVLNDMSGTFADQSGPGSAVAAQMAVDEFGGTVLGKPIKIHWFETGHLGSFAQTDLAIEHQEMMLRFAYSVLG